jgi:SWIM zinc finger
MSNVITNNWEKSAAITVDLIDEDYDEYLVTTLAFHQLNPHQSIKISINIKYCTCGLWQEYETPCKHACAVFWHKFGANIRWIFASASSIYGIETVRSLFRYNLHPVIIDIYHKTKLLNHQNKQQSVEQGVHVLLELGQKSKNNTPTPTEIKTEIKCSLCHMNGHNKATCAQHKLVQDKKAKNEISLL